MPADQISNLFIGRVLFVPANEAENGSICLAFRSVHRSCEHSGRFDLWSTLDWPKLSDAYQRRFSRDILLFFLRSLTNFPLLRAASFSERNKANLTVVSIVHAGYPSFLRS